MLRILSLCAVTAALVAVDAASQIRIVSLNLAKKTALEALGDIERDPGLRNADVLLLQEVVDEEQNRVALDIGKALDRHVSFALSCQPDALIQEGLAILSRFPIRSVAVVPLSRHYLHFHNRVRIALAVTVESPVGPIRVLNLHLDNRLNATDKRNQLRGIWEEVARYPGPTIVGGDFNTGDFLWVSHVVPFPFLQRQRAAVQREMVQHGFSTPARPMTSLPSFHLFRQNLDWIYTRDLSTIDAGVSRIRFSDHNAIWSTLAVAPI